MTTNPKEIVMNMLQQKAQENPMYANLFALVESGNTHSIEPIVRNIARERGIDYDKEFNNFKQK